MIKRYSNERVALCPFDMTDSAKRKYMEWRNDTAYAEYFARHDKVSSVTDIDSWVRRKAESKDEQVVFSVCDVFSEELIGYCTIWVENRTNAVFSICIGEKSYQNKGYGADTIKAMLRFAFEEMGIHRCRLEVLADNVRAVKCYTKCGFTEYGRAHEATYSGGRWRDWIMMEYLEENYARG